MVPRTKKVDVNPAKRGDLFVFPAHSSCTHLHGPTERTVSYPLAIVTSITRAGVIRGYRTVGDSFDQRYTPLNSRLISAHKINVDAAMTAYIARGDSVSRSFANLEDAKTFLKPFLRESPT